MPQCDTLQYVVDEIITPETGGYLVLGLSRIGRDLGRL